MNNTVLKILFFGVGAATGSVVTFRVMNEKLKKKYDEILEEDKKSLRETYANKEVPNPGYINEQIEEAKKISKRYGYTYEEKNNHNNVDSNNARKEDSAAYKPRVISPEQFGEEGYPMISLTYHSDGFVSNDRGRLVTNTAELIGEDFASHFGEYEDDSVFVRNDVMKIDYEILKDYEPFSAEIDD